MSTLCDPMDYNSPGSPLFIGFPRQDTGVSSVPSSYIYISLHFLQTAMVNAGF